MVWGALALGLAFAFTIPAVFAVGLVLGRAHATPASPGALLLPAPSARPAPPFVVEDDGPLGPGEEDDLAASPDPLEGSELPMPERDVPVHDVNILDGCSTADLHMVEQRIDDAIDVGAPEYNRGDFLRCYLEYEKATQEIVATLPRACSGPRKALEQGHAKARRSTDASGRAWALRDAFDGLLDVIDRRGPEL